MAAPPRLAAAHEAARGGAGLTPLVTARVHEALQAARRGRAATAACSLDLGLSQATVAIGAHAWSWDGREFPYLDACRERTVYHWGGARFEPVARFTGSLTKLVATPWGPPTFEIDGIKMLPSARVSPFVDAERKVRLIRPRGKVILDTCAGLGYFAAWCLRGLAARVHSYEKNPDVLWLRTLNPWSPDSPWSPQATGALSLELGDVNERLVALPEQSFDAILHDPPRFAIAGELYGQRCYEQLARVLRRGGSLFHYTGAPNRVSRGRDLAAEVARRLRHAGFAVERAADGLLATKSARSLGY